MKRILTSAIIVILSFNTACIAQISSGRFYSLGNTNLKRTSVKNVHLDDPNDSISSPSSPVLPEQNASTEQSSYSIEELKSLIEKYEREISLRKSKGVFHQSVTAKEYIAIANGTQENLI